MRIISDTCKDCAGLGGECSRCGGTGDEFGYLLWLAYMLGRTEITEWLALRHEQTQAELVERFRVG